MPDQLIQQSGIPEPIPYCCHSSSIKKVITTHPWQPDHQLPNLPAHQPPPPAQCLAQPTSQLHHPRQPPLRCPQPHQAQGQQARRHAAARQHQHAARAAHQQCQRSLRLQLHRPSGPPPPPARPEPPSLPLTQHWLAHRRHLPRPPLREMLPGAARPALRRRARLPGARYPCAPPAGPMPAGPGQGVRQRQRAALHVHLRWQSQAAVCLPAPLPQSWWPAAHRPRPEPGQAQLPPPLHRHQCVALLHPPLRAALPVTPQRPPLP
mmetsp:Transcript_175/g.398  ORF Transcript_175/g.398 Transcript_175/m.398 type:complete len:264 (+) Transcript_175:35-826(+)